MSMNGNGAVVSLDVSDDEEAYVDDEPDDESEDILDIFDPLGIRRIFMGPSRPPLPPMPAPPISSGGVDRATLTTPRGSASLQLPQPVVSKDEFNQATQQLQAAINRNTSRINTIQGDVRSLTQRVGAVAAESRRDIRRVRRDVARARRESTTAIANLRREQSQQATTSMLISFLMQRQIQDQISTHTHDISHTHPFAAGTTAATGNEAANPSGSKAASTATDTSSSLFLLPLLMMGSQGGTTGDAMNWLPLIFLFQ
jgi:hypothetical protein